MDDSTMRRLTSLLYSGALLPFLAVPTAASGVTLTSLKDQNLNSIYGSYAPRGDCTTAVRLTVDESGFTFRALGRTVKTARFEYALTFMGPSYDGISAVFFPFPVDAGNYGPLIMTVNDDEKHGVIRLEDDVPRGQRADPFYALLVANSLYLLCNRTAPAEPVDKAQTKPANRPNTVASGAATPANWTNLPALVGSFPGGGYGSSIDLLESGSIADAIRAQLGAKSQALATNLSVVSPLQRKGSQYWVTGNAPHQGGVEQAYVLLDASRRSVQVGLWEKGSLTVYAPAGGRIAVPPDIARLLAESPPEDAVPLPGTPWEVVPVAGRPPIAYVDAAASTNVRSLSIFCEGTRPTMAILLTKPATAQRVTLSWNFAGRLVDVPLGRGNSDGIVWEADLTNSHLIPMLMQQQGSVMLRINGRLEGEASLSGAPAALRTVMKSCLEL